MTMRSMQTAKETYGGLLRRHRALQLGLLRRGPLAQRPNVLEVERLVRGQGLDQMLKLFHLPSHSMYL